MDTQRVLADDGPYYVGQYDLLDLDDEGSERSMVQLIEENEFHLRHT